MKKITMTVLCLIPMACFSQINFHDKGTGIRSSIGLSEINTQYGKPISQEVLAKFESGKTTYAEVIKTLGKPSAEVSDSSANLLMVQYISQSANVQTNRILLGAIPIVGALANQLAGRTEYKAETRRMTFLFASDTKILIKISDDKSSGEAKERTGLEIIRDTRVGVGEEDDDEK